MKNTLGNNVRLTLFGESHGDIIGVVVDGLPAGIKIDYDFIDVQLAKRRPQKAIETSRVEKDEYAVVSGIFNGFTTGEALTIIVKNSSVRSSDYDKLKDVPRPSHADFVAHEKFKGFNDYRGGGHFSGRLTAAIVAAGAIVISALKKKNIYIGTHIKKCLNIVDRDFFDVEKDIQDLNGKSFPVLDNIENEIKEVIKEASNNKNSVGGVLQTAVVGLPIGLGEPWFTSVEGAISNAVFSIGAVKGIEFGEGFNFANLTGLNANDNFTISNGQIKTTTNHNGGINGGITNGMPVIFNTAVKPTPSIASKQTSVNLKTNEVVDLEITGRHDPAIIRRISVVIDSIVAFVIADLLAIRYGNDFLNFGDK